MIVIALILGLLLRLISLNQSFWLDEATSATVVKTLSFGDIVNKFAPGDFHPPLYYFALKVWSLSFGVNEIWARLLSVLFGLCTVYLVYLIGKSLKSRTLGTIAAILIATAPLHVYYSQEARMYSMETFLVSLAVYLFIKKRWIFFSIVLALVGLTDYLPL
ncbi:MAG: glycosyltransferase family 39 protein, partial [Patescibacteria group bacterium]